MNFAIRTLLTMCFSLIFGFVNSQVPIHCTCQGNDLPNGTLYFDDDSLDNRVYVDTVNLSGNIWQIGTPNKLFCDSSFSGTECLITDTTQAYPVNNRSEATLLLYISAGGSWALSLEGYSKIDTDSLADGGTIEYSSDWGVTWINALTENSWGMNQLPATCSDTVAVLNSIGFSGSSAGLWEHFRFDFFQGPSVIDTVLVRFVFASDSANGRTGGWALDDLNLYFYCSSIEENVIENAICVTPNPAQDEFFIVNTSGESLQKIQLYTSTGQLVRDLESPADRVVTSDLNNGVYTLMMHTDNGIITKQVIIAR